MCRFFAGACWLVLVVTVSAQTGRGSGSISGTVTYGSGLIVPNASVQATHKETGAILRTVSAVDGGYGFPDIAAGVYELSIAVPGCAFDPFAGDVTVRVGQASRLDVRLMQTLNGQTLGDDPCLLADVIRRRSTVPSVPVRRLPDGKPDLSGVWLISQDRFPEQPAALPWAASLAKARIESNFKDAPHVRCLPQGLPVPFAVPPFLTKFVHTPALLVILFEDVPGFRQVFLDGRGHPADPNPTWMGHSVGRWEEDTLVVDTIGFNDRSWINAYPHTEQLHMTERYRRVDFGHLEIRVTFEDPGTFAKPWNMNLTWDLAPQEELIEFVCENNKAEQLVGK